MSSKIRAAAGFTVLELLVVIAVITILAGLLLVALSAAKNRARRTGCLNNLRQINLGVHMYCDDSADASPSLGPAAAQTNIFTLYSGYKQLMSQYVGLNPTSTRQSKLFTCPADSFYANVFYMSNLWQNVQQPLHEQPLLDYSSYAFSGGDNITRLAGTYAYTRLGLGGVKLGAVKHPGRTVLVAEGSAPAPWSWHEPKPGLLYNDAKNLVGFVDGHVSYIKIYFDGPIPKYACFYNPPTGYDYQWSPD